MAEKEERQAAPAGMAGLVRYYESEKSLIKLKPKHVIGLCAAVILIEAMLFIFFPI